MYSAETRQAYTHFIFPLWEKTDRKNKKRDRDRIKKNEKQLCKALAEGGGKRFVKNKA